MSDTSGGDDRNDGDDLEAIREKKRQELLEGDGSENETSGQSPSTPVHVEDAAHFQELTGGAEPVLVDFYADWCGPCKMIEPLLETIADDTPATVASVDVDEHQDIAQQFGVQGIPTLILFADGEAKERTMGIQDESSLRSLVEQYA